MFLLLLLVGSIYGSSINQKREKTFSDIAKEIQEISPGRSNATNFTSTDLRAVFKKLGFKNCSSEVVTTNCQRCLGVEDLLLWNGYQENVTLNSTQFEKLFPSILYLLTPIQNFGAVCNKSIARREKNLTSDRTAFKAFLKQYGATNVLSEKNIEAILEDINKTISDRLTKKPCFDVEEALTGAGVPESGADKVGFNYLSSFIVLQLLHGHCIAEHHHATQHNPKPKDFIDAIFKEYANNGTISSAKFKALLTKLGIGGTVSVTVTDSHAGHNHRRKRSTDDDYDKNEHHRERRSATDSSISGKCYSSESLLKVHSLNEKAGVNQAQFKNICPSLIQQIESSACKNATKAKTKSKEEGWKPWVSSIVAVLLISLGSLVGILVAPFSEGKNFTIVLTFLIAIAVSTLLGDALLHLFPHSLGLHKHEEGAAHVSPLSKNSFIWKSLVFIGGVYIFYIFESVMHSMSKHEHSHGLQETHQHVGKARSHSIVSGPVEIIHERHADPTEHNKDSLIRGASGIHKCDETACIQMDDIKTKEKSASEVYTNKVVFQNGNSKGNQHKNGHSHDGHSHNGDSLGYTVTKVPKLKSIVWMVLIGDSIHNFLDGVAIGVAFTDKFPVGFYGGISTSIAILCHELPHELGDFAILIQSGLSIKVALLLNFVSSLTAILGALIGVSLGQAMDASSWIFAITAGLFVYIALVDMLPELIHSAELRHSPAHTMLFQHAGLLIGFAIMLCLAIFEEEIKV